MSVDIPQGSLKRLRTFFLAWALTGLGGLAGALIGGRVGKQWFFDGGLAGGVIGLALGLAIATRRGWLPIRDRAGALIGGVVGFTIAAPISMAHFDNPITPLAACALVAAGVLLGIGIARGLRGGK
ncbi:MAG: hypothetical protein ABIZ70_14880 [Gemmatimonadales bacterium]